MKKYKNGDIVKGIVSGIEEYGAFVKLDDEYTGLVHISEISDGFVSNVNDFFVLGEEVCAEIIEIDEENKKLKLSIKYRTEDYESDKKIKEVGRGFSTLRDSLDGWIEEKITEINEKNCKKE